MVNLVTCHAYAILPIDKRTIITFIIKVMYCVENLISSSIKDVGVAKGVLDEGIL